MWRVFESLAALAAETIDRLNRGAANSAARLQPRATIDAKTPIWLIGPSAVLANDCGHSHPLFDWLEEALATSAATLRNPTNPL